MDQEMREKNMIYKNREKQINELRKIEISEFEFNQLAIDNYQKMEFDILEIGEHWTNLYPTIYVDLALENSGVEQQLFAKNKEKAIEYIEQQLLEEIEEINEEIYQQMKANYEEAIAPSNTKLIKYALNDSFNHLEYFINNYEDLFRDLENDFNEENMVEKIEIMDEIKDKIGELLELMEW